MSRCERASPRRSQARGWRKSARNPRATCTPPALLFRGFRSAARRPRSLRSVAPCERPFGDLEVKAIGCETEKRDDKDNRIHSIVVAVRSQEADQIAEPFLRNDQLGRDKQDERKRKRGADAIEQLRHRARYHDIPQHA